MRAWSKAGPDQSRRLSYSFGHCVTRLAFLYYYETRALVILYFKIMTVDKPPP